MRQGKAWEGLRAVREHIFVLNEISIVCDLPEFLTKAPPGCKDNRQKSPPRGRNGSKAADINIFANNTP
jgi:hypothetical protein